MKKQLLSIVLLVGGVGTQTLAFSVNSVMPYVAIAGASLYSAYRLSEIKGHDIAQLKNLPLHEQLPYGTLLLATGCCLYNSYAHHCSTKEMEHKLEGAQEAVMQVSLAKLQSTIEEIERRYSAARESKLNDEQLALYTILSTRIKEGNSLEKLESTLLNDSKQLRISKNILEVIIKEGARGVACHNPKEQLIFDALGQKLVHTAELIACFVDKLSLSFQEHKPFFILEQILKKNAYSDYVEEKHLMEACTDVSVFTGEIERLANVKYPTVTYQFPLLSYVEFLVQRKSDLERALRNLKGYKAFAFQNGALTEAQEIVTTLQTLIQCIVNTDSYKAQKAQKPLFDRNEEVHKQQLKEQQLLFDAKLRERQIALEIQKKAVENKLLKRAHEARTLEHNRLLVEQAVTQQRLEKQKMEHEREAFRNGQQVREAVAKNDQEWTNKYENLRSRLKGTEHVEADYNDLKDTVQRELKEWKSVKAKVHQELNELEDALNVPPAVQKEDEQGLKNYLALLKKHVDSAQKALPACS